MAELDEFRAIPEWPNYEVSRSGVVRNRVTGHPLKPTNETYPRVRLYETKEGTLRGRGVNIHRIVAAAWVLNPDPEVNTVVNHLNGNTSDWNASNLEWTTAAGNNRHAIDTGLRPTRSCRLALIGHDPTNDRTVRYPSVPAALEATGLTEYPLRAAIGTGQVIGNHSWSWEEPEERNNETWEPVGIVGGIHYDYIQYSVSNYGRIRNEDTGRHLKCHTTKTGYPFGVLTSAERTSRRVLVHRLVAYTHIGLPQDPIATEVDHIDGNPLNSHVTNLQWISPHEHAKKTHCKRIVQKTQEGEIVAIHESVNAAAAAVGKHINLISRVARGAGRICAGFRWEYAAKTQKEVPRAPDPEMEALIEDLIETFEGL